MRNRSPKKRNRDVIMKGKQEEHLIQSPKVSLGMISCPVKGCQNFGGKRYKRSYIFQYLKSHVAQLLTNPKERKELNKNHRTFSNHVYCKKCCHVVAQADAEQLCIACGQSSLLIGAVTDSIDEIAKMELKTKIRRANKTHLRILSNIPRSLQGLWSSCVTSTIMKFAAVKTELE